MNCRELLEELESLSEEELDSDVYIVFDDELLEVDIALVNDDASSVSPIGAFTIYVE